MFSLLILIVIVAAVVTLAHKSNVRRVDANSSVFAGVCGGLARSLKLPPLAVRIVYIGLSLVSGGIGLAVYIALALSLPRE